MRTQQKSLNRADKTKIEERLAGYDWSALHWMERACREARKYKVEGLGQKTLAEKQAAAVYDLPFVEHAEGNFELLVDTIADVLKYDVS